jgi:LmbE family N-acetylglucosaminyl deacetylase
MNVLFVGAHHDDLEVSSGGSVKRWVEEGCNVFSAILTDSTWTSPDGIRFRDPQQVESYCQKAARLLGYTQISLNYGPCFTLLYSDEKVTDLLQIISQHKIDMLVTISPFDAHRDHRVASEIALAATRKIPRVLLTQVSWNSTPQVFNPRYFVDITKQFEVKREAIRCYEDEYARTGHLWEKFIQAQGQLFGLQAGCEMAEGFEVVKFLD